MPDMVNHPEHYTYGNRECIDEMILLFGVEAVVNFCRCSAYKYKYRHGHKGTSADAALDLQKAEWYLNKAEELLQGTTNKVLKQNPAIEISRTTQIRGQRYWGR